MKSRVWDFAGAALVLLEAGPFKTFNITPASCAAVT